MRYVRGTNAMRVTLFLFSAGMDRQAKLDDDN
jgi:hypothetical protein